MQNKLNEVKINVFQYLFSEEAKLHNELQVAQENFFHSEDPLDLYELMRAFHRVEVFEEIYKNIAILINS